MILVVSCCDWVTGMVASGP